MFSRRAAPAPPPKNLWSALLGKAPVVMGLKGATYTIEELQSAGVKRISVGGSFARAALGAFIRAAREVKERGTFTYSADAIPDAEASAYMSNFKR